MRVDTLRQLVRCQEYTVDPVAVAEAIVARPELCALLLSPTAPGKPPPGSAGPSS
jgi:hypothetical protein